MSSADIDSTSWSTKLVARMGRKLRSNKDYTQEVIDKQNTRERRQRLQRRADHAHKHGYIPRRMDQGYASQANVNELGERKMSTFSEAPTLVERPRDHTDMIHGLTHHDSFDSLVDRVANARIYADPDAFLSVRAYSQRHEMMIESLPPAVWQNIADQLAPADAARLRMASRTLFHKLGPAYFGALDRPENVHEKVRFLQDMDRQLPRHLFCFVCAQYHLRLTPGKEALKVDFNTNPLFMCPRVKESVLPRMRLVHGRELPYAFIQLALRHARYSPAHGISHEALARRWKHAESGWSHRTRYMVHNDRLLMRIVSQVTAPPASTMTETSERHLLYDREEYLPFFSVCAHWRDGELMKVCKCALSHVPAPPQSYRQQLQKAPTVSRSLARPNFLVARCDFCRPARRCPECPTEYLVEIQMLEDLSDTAFPFKHNLIVSRWTDLGDGRSPYTSPEYAAITGIDVGSTAGSSYQSFSAVGRRAVAGIFESEVSGWIPGQRMVSLNPKNKKAGEDGHGWY